MAKFPSVWFGGPFAAVLVAAPLPAMAQAKLAFEGDNSLVRGSPSTISISLAVKAKAVSFHRLYVRVRCKEFVELTYSPPEEKGSKAGPPKPIVIKQETVLFEKEIPFTIEKEYKPGSTTTLKTQVDLSAQLPPSARGKLAQIKWEADAAGDVVGKFWDATTGWQEITVK